MKKLVILSSILLVQVAVFAQDHYKIEGKVINIDKYGLKDGDSVWLKFQFPKTLQGAVIKNQEFKFEGNLKEPSIAMLTYKSSGVKLFIDTNEFNIRLIEKKIAPDKFLYQPEIKTKSPLHNNYINFVDLQVALNDKKVKLINQLDSTKSITDEETLKNKIASVDFEIKQSFKDNAIKNNNNPAAAYVLTAAPDFSYKNYWQVYQQLTNQVKNSTFGKMALEKLMVLKNLAGETQLAK